METFDKLKEEINVRIEGRCDRNQSYLYKEISSMFKTLIEQLQAWSHPDLVEQHTKRRLAKLHSDFNWKNARDAKEGRKFTEITHYPKDDLHISIEKAFCNKLEAEGFKIEVEVIPGGTCHYIKILWRD